MSFSHIKLNLGASPIWQKDGWCVLDHKLDRSEGSRIAGDAKNIDLPDGSCDVVFCSHVFEHIPHLKLPLVVAEINRILAPGGILRILTPDLEVVCKAYVNKDRELFRRFKEEDESLRTDLGLGGMLMNFIVSPGQDTIFLDRNLKEFIGGYAHLYCYDYEMLSGILNTLSFVSERGHFGQSRIAEMNEPLHVTHLPAVWEDMNRAFYDKHGLIHRLVDGKYEINFKVTGFDRDPLTSLIIEARKESVVSKAEADRIFNASESNYNRYGRSLLTNADLVAKLRGWGIPF